MTLLSVVALHNLLDMSSGQMEPEIDRLPRVNEAGVPLNLKEVWSLPGVFLFHRIFLFAEIADVLIWFSSACLTKLSVSYADIPPILFPTRPSCLFPFDRGLCIIPTLLIPSSQNDSQFMSSGVPVGEVQMAGTDGNVKMKHKLKSWTLITKEAVPNTWSLKKTLVHKDFLY